MSAVSEQRLTKRLISYWQVLQRDRNMPQIEQFNGSAVEDIWQQCVMFSVDARRRIYLKLEYMGSHIIHVYGHDVCGRMVDSKSIFFPGKAMYEHMKAIVLEPKCESMAGSFLNEKGDMVKYRACILPFGSQTRGVTHIIVGLAFQAF